MPHVTTLKVRFYELDPYDHVNHAAYIQYFESARVELLDSVGIGLGPLKRLGFHLVVTELATKFLRSAGAGDELRIETEVLEIRRASSRWGQRLYRGDELIASQEIVAATTTTEGRPVRFPDEMADKLRPFLVTGGS
jgi:acyl-CoA thioester hydrolase